MLYDGTYSSAALIALELVVAAPTAAAQTAAIVCAASLGAVARFTLLRTWVFARDSSVRHRCRPAHADTVESHAAARTTGVEIGPCRPGNPTPPL